MTGENIKAQAITEKVSDFTKETSFHGLKYIFDSSARTIRRLAIFF